MLAFLRNLLRHSPRQRPDLHFVFMTRANCHLCDEALAILEEARRVRGFGIEIVDVDSSPDLVAEHGDHIPVVIVGDKVRFRGHVNPILLQRILDARE